MTHPPSPRRTLLPLLGFLVLGAAQAFEIGKNMEVSSKKPVKISADTLTFDRPRGLTLFTGKVKALHDQIILLSDKLQALEDNREAAAEGKVRVLDQGQGITMTCGNLEYEDRMNLMVAHDDPRLTASDENGKPITISGRQMELDAMKKNVVIHQNVHIDHQDGNAEAQLATFDSQTDQVILEEDPKFTMPNGVLTGRRIISRMAGDKGLVVEGMAEGYFNPSGKPVIPATGKGVPTPGVLVPPGASLAPGVQATPSGPTSPVSR